jgi:SOS-response transcriptional repressor LexA
MLTGKELGRAIAKALADNGKTQADAARYFVVKPPSVSGWIKTGRISKDNFDRLRSWLTKTPDSFWGTETGPVRYDAALEEMFVGAGVPVISWTTAGCWADVVDPFQPGDADDWMPCPVKHGPQTYALKIKGESMKNPEGRPSYNDGDIIFVDPDKQAKHGDRVIVRLDDQQEATFKQLLIEDGKTLLKALNPDWKPRYIEINGNATMCGVVIGKWVPE